jgi:hypothetical protein
MNPPTTGHKLLVDKVKHIAHQKGADHEVFLSSSHDDKKNPLTHKDKVRFVKEMMPGTNVHEDSSKKHVLDVMKHLQSKGYKKATMVVGGDRKQEFHNLLHKYNGDKYHFDQIHVESAGDRDPDAENVTGMSASKMRAHAKSGNFKEFAKGVPNRKHAKELYQHVRKGLQIESHRAIFLLGAPGSGKDHLLKTTMLSNNNLFEIDMNKLHKALTEGFRVDGTPLIVNGSSEDLNKVFQVKNALEEQNYLTGCVVVYTDDETSKKRNAQRLQPLEESVRASKYLHSISNFNKFYDNFHPCAIYNNSYDIHALDSTIKEQVELWNNELDDLLEKFLATDYYTNINLLAEGFLFEEDPTLLPSNLNKLYKGRKTSKQSKLGVTSGSTQDFHDSSNAGQGVHTTEGVMFKTDKPNSPTTIKKAVKKPFTAGQIRPLSQDGGATYNLATHESLELPEPKTHITRNSGNQAGKIVGKPNKGSTASSTMRSKSDKPDLTKAAKPPKMSYDGRAGDDMSGVSTLGCSFELDSNNTIVEIRSSLVSNNANTVQAKPPYKKGTAMVGDTVNGPGMGEVQNLTLSFEEFRQKNKRKSPEVEKSTNGAQYDPDYMEDLRTDTDAGGDAMQEQYEDWGIMGKEVLFEGRTIKLNKPFKVSHNKYKVYLQDEFKTIHQLVLTEEEMKKLFTHAMETT